MALYGSGPEYLKSCAAQLLILADAFREDSVMQRRAGKDKMSKSMEAKARAMLEGAEAIRLQVVQGTPEAVPHARPHRRTTKLHPGCRR